MKKIFSKLNIAGVFMLVVCALFGVADCASLMAAAVVTTSDGRGGNPVSPTLTESPLDLKGTNENAEDFIRPTVNDLVTKIRPSLFPLDTVMRQCKSRKARSMEFQWYSSDIRPVSSEVVSATSANTDTNGYFVATIEITNPGLFAESDTILVEGVRGTLANGNPQKEDLVLFVVGKTNNDELRVIAINGDVTNNGIAVPVDSFVTTDDGGTPTKFYRMARAASDGDMRTASFAALPVKSTNYCQIFKFCISMSTLQQLSEKEVNWGMSEIEEQGMYEFRMGMEASALFGVGGKVVAPNGKEVYFTKGIVSSIEKRHNLPAGDITNDDLVAMCRDIFQGNAGTRKRIMFAGSGMNEALAKIKTVNKQLEAGNTVTAWGLEWKEIRSNFGTLLLMQHDLLDMYGYTDKAIVIDPDFIDKYEFVPLSATELDTKKSGEFDGDVKIWTEVAGYALRYPSCHCIIARAEAVADDTNAGGETGNGTVITPP